MPINDGFLKEIRHLIPNKDWKVSRSGIWQYFSPKNSDIPLQGWKIHISATYNNRVKIAQKAIEVLVKNSIHFKVIYYLIGDIKIVNVFIIVMEDLNLIQGNLMKGL